MASIRKARKARRSNIWRRRWGGFFLGTTIGNYECFREIQGCTVILRNNIFLSFFLGLRNQYFFSVIEFTSSHLGRVVSQVW